MRQWADCMGSARAVMIMTGTTATPSSSTSAALPTAPVLAWCLRMPTAIHRIEAARARLTDNRSASSDVLFFEHSHKAGGTTVVTLARSNAVLPTLEKNGRPLSQTQGSLTPQLVEFWAMEPKAALSYFGSALRERKRPLFVAAESSWPLPAHLMAPDPVSYVLVVRHPIDRLVSLFWWRRDGGSRSKPAHQPAATLPTEHFLDALLRNETNYYVRMFSQGACKLPPPLQSPPEASKAWERCALPVATRTLGFFSVVLLTERLDDSAALLRLTLGWRNLPKMPHGKLNEAPRPRDAVAAVEAWKPRAISSNEIDLRWYAKARVLGIEQLGWAALPAASRGACPRLAAQDSDDGLVDRVCPHSRATTRRRRLTQSIEAEMDPSRCTGANVIVVGGFHHSGTTVVQHELLRQSGVNVTHRFEEAWPDPHDRAVRCSATPRIYKHPTNDLRRLHDMLGLRQLLPNVQLVFVVRQTAPVVWSLLRRLNTTDRADVARELSRQHCEVLRAWHSRTSPRSGFEWTLALDDFTADPDSVATRLLCNAGNAGAARWRGELASRRLAQSLDQSMHDVVIKQVITHAQKLSRKEHDLLRERQVLSTVYQSDEQAFSREASPAIVALIRSFRCDECGSAATTAERCAASNARLLPPCPRVREGRALSSADDDLHKSRSAAGSATEPRLMTIATEPTSCDFVRFRAFARQAGLEPTVLTPNADAGFACSRPGTCKHGGKLKALADATATLPAEQLVVFVDGYDAIVVVPEGVQGHQVFRDAYRRAVARGGVRSSSAMGAVLLAAESNLYLQFGTSTEQRRFRSLVLARLNRSTGLFRYVNSGGIMGPAQSVHALVQGALDTFGKSETWNGQSDQALLTAVYAMGLPSVANAGVTSQRSAASPFPPLVLDTEQTVFATASRVTWHPRDVSVSRGGVAGADGGVLLHAITGSRPLVYHVPGPKYRGYPCDFGRLADEGLRVPPNLRRNGGAEGGEAEDGLTCRTRGMCTRAEQAPAEMYCEEGHRCKRPSPEPPMVVVYNRVSKAASTSMLEVIQRLSHGSSATSGAGFTVQRGTVSEWVSNDGGTEQMRQRLIRYIRNGRLGGHRVLFAQHMPTVAPYPHHPPSLSSATRLTYINIVREPVARAVSFFYYTLFSADRPAGKRAQALAAVGFGSNVTLADCLGPAARVGAPAACAGALARPQLEYFCAPAPGSRPQGGAVVEALRQGRSSDSDGAGGGPRAHGQDSAIAGFAQCTVGAAMANVEHQFAVVGLVERFNETLMVLEHVLPHFFRGATAVGRAIAPRRVTRTVAEYARPAPATLAVLARAYAPDVAFYEQVKARFVRMAAVAASAPRVDGVSPAFRRPLHSPLQRPTASSWLSRLRSSPSARASVARQGAPGPRPGHAPG